jgi:hypothetical protein
MHVDLDQEGKLLGSTLFRYRSAKHGLFDARGSNGYRSVLGPHGPGAAVADACCVFDRPPINRLIPRKAQVSIGARIELWRGCRELTVIDPLP